MNKKHASNKIFWGVGCILAAVVLVLSKLGVCPAASVTSILLTVLWVWIFIQGLVHVNFYVMFLSAAFVGIIYDKQLGIEALTPWTILLAAVLLGFGFSILFHKKPWFARKEWNLDRDSVMEDVQMENGLYYKNAFGSTTKYIDASDYTDGRFVNSFGELSVYFDNAILSQAKGNAYFDNSFGCIKLYVPKTWMIMNNVDVAFGSVVEKNRSQAIEGSPVLTLAGKTSFGTIEIYYI